MVSHNLNLEGASISLFDLSNAFSKMSDVNPILLSLSDGVLASKYEEHDIPQISLPFSEGDLRSSETVVNAINKLGDVFDNVNPAVVFVNTILGYPVVHAAYEKGVPVVWIIRESQSLKFWRDYLGNRIELVLEAFKYVNRLVFVAKSTRELWLSQLDIDTGAYIPNALNKNNFEKQFSGNSKAAWRQQWGIPRNAIIFLCVGTFHERKGQMDLVKAITNVAGDSVVVCVGDAGGEYSNQLNKFKSTLSDELQKKIYFIARQENVGDAYNSADVFVCCSRNESYPRVILEAMECGLPIISTPVYGISEQLEFGVNALEYSPGDVDQLSQNIQLFTDDSVLRKCYGEASKVRVGKLSSFDQMIKRYREIFDHLLPQ
jgi:glycosyltransferase involved in cell wall biosynthesis